MGNRKIKRTIFFTTKFNYLLTSTLIGASSFDAKNVFAYTQRNLSYGQLGDYQQALADINKAISINPQDSSLYSNDV